MRNQKGITLVALVVTIVVLLILAGTSIAMLSGDNGIITNAQKSDYANTEGEAMDKIKMAFNTLKTQIIVKSSTITDYKATGDMDNLVLLLQGELPETGYTVTKNGTDKIDIKYDDGKIFTGTTASTNGKPPFKAITYTITITDLNASITTDYTRQIITN